MKCMCIANTELLLPLLAQFGLSWIALYTSLPLVTARSSAVAFFATAILAFLLQCYDVYAFISGVSASLMRAQHKEAKLLLLQCAGGGAQPARSAAGDAAPPTVAEAWPV